MAVITFIQNIFGMQRTTRYCGHALFIVVVLGVAEKPKASAAEHLSQQDILGLVLQGREQEAFDLAFEHGDELFERTFTAADGVGANVGNGSRFTRVPRVDLIDRNAWGSHSPPRVTGPNAEACNACHNKPSDDGAGGIEANVVRDPLRLGNSGSFIERNTPHVFGAGAIQLLAEEMTADLQRRLRTFGEAACSSVQDQRRFLNAKGVDFGAVTVRVVGLEPCEVDVDLTELKGVPTDLVIRPFRWKGEDITLRAFIREAANNELGLQAEELVGRGSDGDFDGVVDELSVGDITALEIYVAAQPRPVTTVELAELGLIPPLGAERLGAIAHGERLFHRVGCARCHRPTLLLDDPVYRAPSRTESFRDELFPGGLDPLDEGLDPAFPSSFDLTRDHPDNIVVVDGEEHRLGSFERDSRGRVIIPLFSDLKRHDMGSGLADSVDETGSGASVWLTKELWGVGSTAPYLHDGRATTLDEAIRAHGGEAASSRRAYEDLSEDRRDAIIAFLDNLVLFRLEEEDEE